jgi:hypothetical protein
MMLRVRIGDADDFHGCGVRFGILDVFKPVQSR